MAHPQPAIGFSLPYILLGCGYHALKIADWVPGM